MQRNGTETKRLGAVRDGRLGSSPAVPLPDDLVFGFSQQQQIGSVVRCSPGSHFNGPHAERLPSDTALYILAPATEKDWKRCVRSFGSISRPLRDPEHTFFYFVRTD